LTWLKVFQYSGKEVPHLEEDIDVSVKELIDLVERKCVTENKSMDFAVASGYFTLDALTKLAFGDALGFLRADSDLYDYHKSSAAFYPIMELSSNHPSILAFLNSPIMRGAAPKPTDKVGFGAIVGVSQKAIAARFAPESDKAHIDDDMLASFKRHGLSQQECEVESLLQILAGADSTATALRMTFYYLLTSPPSYRQLQASIDNAVSAGGVSSPIISNAQAQEQPYLQACIQEGLRMFMPLQGLAGLVAPKGGATISGIFFPEGTELAAHEYARGHSPAIYGDDAYTFRPERWLDTKDEKLEARRRVNDAIFGTGRTSCLGRPIAMMEMSKALFEVSGRAKSGLYVQRLTRSLAISSFRLHPC
jgi:cytochrome P450